MTRAGELSGIAARVWDEVAWGPARRVPLPGEIAGIGAQWRVEAGPLSRHEPVWAEN